MPRSYMLGFWMGFAVTAEVLSFCLELNIQLFSPLLKFAPSSGSVFVRVGFFKLGSLSDDMPIGGEDEDEVKDSWMMEEDGRDRN